MMNCIIHYEGYEKEHYSEIKPVSENVIKRIFDAKVEREKYEDSRNHLTQCSSIPNEIDVTVHGVHLQPCYAVFTHILI